MNTIPKDQIVNSVIHRYAGNDWAVVEPHCDEQWTRVVGIGKGNVGSQAFRVWTKLLSVGVPMNPEVLVKIKAIRLGLESGKLKVVSSHIVKA